MVSTNLIVLGIGFLILGIGLWFIIKESRKFNEEQEAKYGPKKELKDMKDSQRRKYLRKL